jgi:dolichol-phosphate mannosyltransferase
MHEVFLSIVSLVDPDISLVNKYLKKISQVLQKKFSSYEIILVNCNQETTHRSLLKEISLLEDAVLKEVSIYNLSNRTDKSSAIVAGLDNAHGDYVILLDMNLGGETDIIEKLFLETQRNFDIVYLKYEKRRIPLIRKNLIRFFYFLVNKFSDLELDYRTHSNRIISRRALNRLLMNRGDWNFLTANLSDVGYSSSYLISDISTGREKRPLYDDVRRAVAILMSVTTLFNKLFLYLFFVSLSFSILVIVNALLVRFYGHDILWYPRDYVPGWAFIVVFLAITFNILLVILYFLYIYLTTIYNQVIKKPMYTIESIDKF